MRDCWSCCGTGKIVYEFGDIGYFCRVFKCWKGYWGMVFDIGNYFHNCVIFLFYLEISLFIFQ